MSLKGKNFLSIHDLTVNEVEEILHQAAVLKEKQKKGEEHQLLKGKTLGMIFQKASTRTRVSFEVGMWQLGGKTVFLTNSDSHLGRGELMKDTARILSRYVDGIVIRTYGHEIAEELAEYSSVPVINALTDKLHPCQALTDIFTIYEKKQKLTGLKLAYIGDGNNMVHSLMFAGAKTGMQVAVATPKGYYPDNDIVNLAKQDALLTGAKITITENPAEAIKDADVVYTDVWASMGQESDLEARKLIFKDFQVNKKLMEFANADAVVMHCLPAHRGEEITADVLEGSQSIVFDQAENRLHVQKAILALIMG